MEHLLGLSWTPRATPLTARGLFTAMWDSRKTRKCVFLSPDIVTASNVTVAKTCLTVISPPSLKRMRIYHFLKRIQAQCPHRGGADGKMSWRGRLNFTIERAYKITPFCRSLYDLFAIKMRSFLNRKIFNNIVKRF